MSKASSGSGAAHASLRAGKVRSSSARTVFSALMQCLERNRGARQLHALDDFMLKDIGLSRADILTAVHSRGKRHG